MFTILFVLIVTSEFLVLVESESLEIKCDEIKKIAYYETYNETICTFQNVDADSATTFIVRSGNYYEYANKITEVVFSSSKLYDIPKQLFIAFRYLKTLELNNCDMSDISRHCFDYANNLVELRAQLNNFERLPSNVFISAPQLQSIDLSANKLSKLDDKSFAKLVQLENLLLSENLIDNINEKLFAPLVSLKKLKLDSNKLKKINENIFDQNLNLTEIWLNTNQIESIIGNPFDKLTNLRILNLAYNNLHEIRIENTFVERLLVIGNHLTSLKVNKNLKSLIAPYNQLETIDFNDNRKLLEIRLRENKLTILQNFSQLTEVENLDLSFNKIGKLDISTFAKMKSLSRLNLESTNITIESLNYGTFSHNINLTQLDLSYNQLGKIDFAMFSSLHLLSHLKIDGNNLTEIPHANIKSRFPKLILISLNDNDWNCTYLADMIQSLKKSNLVVYIFSLSKVLDSPNVDGIACHNNRTDHVYWQRAIVHDDDDEDNNSPSHKLKQNFTALKMELGDLQNSVNNMSKQISWMINSLKNFNDSPFQTNSPKSAEQATKFRDADYVTQSQISAMRFFLVITSLTIFAYMGFILIKYLKANYGQRRIFYPSVSTVTLRTSLEQEI